MQRQGGLEKMKRIIIGILSGALLTGAATMSFADEKIKDRKQNQQKRIAQAYPARADGRRLLAFPRLFMVASR